MYSTEHAKLSSVTRDISEFAARGLTVILPLGHYGGSMLTAAMTFGSHLIGKLKRPTQPVSFEKLHGCHLKGAQ